MPVQRCQVFLSISHVFVSRYNIPLLLRVTTNMSWPSEHWQQKCCRLILSRAQSVNIEGVWIDDRIYWTLWYSWWLYFTIHYYTHIHTLVSSRLHWPLLGSGFNGRRSPSSGFPNCSWSQLPASNVNSSQQLNNSSSLTDWLLFSQSQSYFTTGGLLPIGSAWRKTLWDPWPLILFSNWTLVVIVLM
jgi:hypothetical protein